MKAVIFRCILYLEKIITRYRFDFYCYKYSENIDAGTNIAFGKNTAVVIFASGTRSKLSIKNNCDFRRNCIITLDGVGMLTIRENNFFNNGCSITCLNEIEVGQDNLFGENVKIYDHNHIFSDPEISIRNQGFNKGKVVIGNNCWIGSNCIILNGVTIGSNVIIGANNLIYKSIPSNTIVKSVAQVTIINRI